MRTLLVSAYACEPLKGSEPAVGWNWVLQLAKFNKVHVITRANNETIINQHLPVELKDNIKFHYYDTPNSIKRLKKKDKGLYFYYFCWQIGIVKLAKHIIQKEHVDYTIHLTFGSMWMPTFLPILKTRFIWGPMGGGECVPMSCLSILPWRQKIVQAFRYLLNATTILNLFILLPVCQSKAILARTPNTKNILPAFCRKKTHVLLETAMEDNIFQYEKKVYDSTEIELIISARLISIKNIPMVIRSLKQIKTDKKWRLTILGSGPDKKIVLNEIAKQKLDNVEIIPFMAREEALKKILSSDVFVFPSLKEGGTWALMEAMAMGLPVVCFDWAGMSVETNDDTAIRLKVGKPEQMEIEMGNAISNLINSAHLREKLGRAARLRIKKVFNWDAKGAFMEQLFEDIDKLCQ